MLNDADSNDDLYEPEDEDLDLELDLDQRPVPRILRDYHNDSDDEPGHSNVRSRSRSRSTSRGDSPVIGVDIEDSDNYEPPTARRRINNSMR